MRECESAAQEIEAMGAELISAAKKMGGDDSRCA
jgi:hypothetical protein